jgi:hypothetical protein
MAWYRRHREAKAIQRCIQNLVGFSRSHKIF